MELKNAETG